MSGRCSLERVNDIDLAITLKMKADRLTRSATECKHNIFLISLSFLCYMSITVCVGREKSIAIRL